MSCPAEPAEMFADGEWLDAILCWLTASGDPTLAIVIPSIIYGTVLVGLFIVGNSPIIPIAVSIILAGVIFVAFPASALQILLIAMIMTVTIGGLVLTWRMGR